MKKYWVALSVIFFAFSSISYTANAAIKAGVTCTKLNSTSTVEGVKYTCIKLGKKLVWNKGVKLDKLDPTSTTSPKTGDEIVYKVGDLTPEGGKVFYVADKEMAWGRYLEFAPFGWQYSLPDVQAPLNKQSMSDPIAGGLKCPNFEVHYQTSSAIGAGRINTELLSKACNYTFLQLVKSYRGGGLDDWYVPSINELNELCKYARGQSTGNDATPCTNAGNLNSEFSAQYLSSTGVTQSTIRAMSMVAIVPNTTAPKPFTISVTAGLSIRPIRAFSTNKSNIARSAQPTHSPFPDDPKFEAVALDSILQGSQIFDISQAITTDPALKMKLIMASNNTLTLNSRVLCSYKFVTYGVTTKPNDMSTFRGTNYRDPLSYPVSAIIKSTRATTTDYFTCVVSDSDNNFLGSASVLIGLFK